MKSKTVRYGFILAIISILVQILVYATNVEWMASVTYSLLSFLLSLILVIYFGLQLRKARGGFASFKEMFSDIFIMLLVAGVIGILFNYVLFNFIDPQLAETLKQAVIKNSQAMFSKIGMSDSEIDTALAEIEKQDMSVTLVKSIQQLGMVVTFSAIGAVILAAILKKKPEEAFQ